jgi:hypothetical protein
MRVRLIPLFGTVWLLSVPAVAVAQTAGTFPSPCASLPADRTPDDGNANNDGGWQLVNFCSEVGPPRPGCHHNDDLSARIEAQLNRSLAFDFELFGQGYQAGESSVFVNNNGNLSFDVSFPTFTADAFPLPVPLVAPFWADVDTGDQNNDTLGHVWFQEIGANTLAVAWDEVGYFDEQGGKRNTFQVMISDGTNASMGAGNNVCFCYDDMQWTTGDASGGVAGLGGSPATAGLNAGDDTNFFRIGHFDQAGDAFDGGSGSNDGVDFLDGQAFCFDVRASNAPPIPVGGEFPPPPTTSRVSASCEGGAIRETIRFESPETGQTTTVVVSDPDGAQNAGLVVQAVPGQTAVVDLDWSADPLDVGSYTLTLTATDDGQPASAATSVDLGIDIVCPDPGIVYEPTDVPAWPEAVAVREDSPSEIYAFVAAQEAGLLIYDVTDPNAIGAPISSFVPTAAECPNGFFFDDVILTGAAEFNARVSAGPCGLVGIRVQDPAAPAFLGRNDLLPEDRRSIWAKDAAVLNSDSPFIFVAEFFEGLHILDRTTLPAPEVLARFGPADDPNFGNALAVAVDPIRPLVFVATTNGLRVINVQDPLAPVLSASFDTATVDPNAIPQDVVLFGNRIYLPVWQAGLRVLELTPQGIVQQIQMLSEQFDPPFFKMAPIQGRMLAVQGLAGARSFNLNGLGMLIPTSFDPIDSGAGLASNGAGPEECCWAWNLDVLGNRVFIAFGDLTDPLGGRLQAVDLPQGTGQAGAQPLGGSNGGFGAGGVGSGMSSADGVVLSLASADATPEITSAPRTAEHLAVPSERVLVAPEPSPEAPTTEHESSAPQATRAAPSQSQAVTSNPGTGGGGGGWAITPSRLPGEPASLPPTQTGSGTEQRHAVRTVGPNDPLADSSWADALTRRARSAPASGRAPAGTSARPTSRPETIGVPQSIPRSLPHAASTDVLDPPGSRAPGVALASLLAALAWLLWRYRKP